MLIHHLSVPKHANRTVVLGGGGFVGGAIVERLRADGAEVLSITRADIDLASDAAADRLAKLLDAEDAVAFVAAKAPVHTPAMLAENTRIIAAVTEALQRRPVSYVLNIGSDAVYGDSAAPLTEDSLRNPGSLHGIMHLAREQSLEQTIEGPWGTLRPTLIYGARDPHNGYGPNRFLRQARSGEDIVLFGDGEERRDHIAVEDVAELAVRMLLHRSSGALNAATGEVVSFRAIADLVVDLVGSNVAIRSTPRSGPMPHNGYRPFDIGEITNAFPEFKPQRVEEGLRNVVKQLNL